MQVLSKIKRFLTIFEAILGLNKSKFVFESLG